jgi:hypothetical protein
MKVRGAAMNTIFLVSPPSFTRVIVSASDTSRQNFIWTKASSNPTVNYKIKIKKVAAGSLDFIFTSNSGGLDTVAGLRKSLLDSLAGIMGTTGDSVRCTWRAWSYNGVDSLQSSNSFLVTLVRSTIGIQIISSEIPGTYALYNNFPNPFNPVTKIRFDLPGNSNGKITNVKIVVFDVLGQQQEVIVNQNLQPGRYSETGMRKIIQAEFILQNNCLNS